MKYKDISVGQEVSHFEDRYTTWHVSRYKNNGYGHVLVVRDKNDMDKSFSELKEGGYGSQWLSVYPSELFGEVLKDRKLYYIYDGREMYTIDRSELDTTDWKKDKETGAWVFHNGVAYELSTVNGKIYNGSYYRSLLESAYLINGVGKGIVDIQYR